MSMPAGWSSLPDCRIERHNVKYRPTFVGYHEGSPIEGLASSSTMGQQLSSRFSRLLPRCIQGVELSPFKVSEECNCVSDMKEVSGHRITFALMTKFLAVRVWRHTALVRRQLALFLPWTWKVRTKFVQPKIVFISTTSGGAE